MSSFTKPLTSCILCSMHKYMCKKRSLADSLLAPVEDHFTHNQIFFIFFCGFSTHTDKCNFNHAIPLMLSCKSTHIFYCQTYIRQYCAIYKNRSCLFRPRKRSRKQEKKERKQELNQESEFLVSFFFSCFLTFLFSFINSQLRKTNGSKFIESLL